MKKSVQSKSGKQSYCDIAKSCVFILLTYLFFNITLSEICSKEGNINEKNCKSSVVRTCCAGYVWMRNNKVRYKDKRITRKKTGTD